MSIVSTGATPRRWARASFDVERPLRASADDRNGSLGELRIPASGHPLRMQPSRIEGRSRPTKSRSARTTIAVAPEKVPTNTLRRHPRKSGVHRTNPLLYPKPCDTFELAGVVRDQAGVFGQCVAGGPEGVRADWRAGGFKAGGLFRAQKLALRGCFTAHGWPGIRSTRRRRCISRSITMTRRRSG